MGILSRIQLESAVNIGSRPLLGSFPIHIGADYRLVAIIQHMPFHFVRPDRSNRDKQNIIRQSCFNITFDF